MTSNTKKFVLALVLIFAVVCTVALAACDETQTATYSVTVVKGTGVDLDLSKLTAQWMSGSDVKASAKLSADGKASVELEPGNYTVSLTGDGLADYEYTAASVTDTKCDATITINAPAPTTATYTVSVTCDDSELDLTGITAVWKSGDVTKGSAKLSAAGVASVTLDKGSYTVTLTGEALSAYNFSDASVNESNTNANIALTKKGPAMISYTVSVTTNDSELNLTTLAVQWVGSAGTQSSLLGADGKASVTLVEGEYTVTIVGLTKADYYQYSDATVTADAPHAEITLTVIKRDIAVTVSSPVAFPNDVKVQVKDGSDNYGDPVAISEGKANVVAPYGKAVSLVLVGLDAYNYLESAPVEVAATDKSATVSVSLAEVEYTITVTAPEDVDVDELTVTLLSDGEPVADATELALENGIATVTLVAGNYTVQINGLNTTDYAYDEASVTISSHSVTVAITEKFWTISPNGKTTSIGTFADENEVKRIKLKGVEHSHFYSISMSSDVEDADGEFNLHNFTVNYGEEQFVMGKTRIEEELDTFIVIYIVDGIYELTVNADGAFAQDVVISIEEYEEIDTTIELDVAKEIYATTTYNFVAPTDSAYLITIDTHGLAYKDFQISMEDGPIFGDGSNRTTATTYEFFGLENEPFSIGVYLYASGTITITISRTFGDFILDQSTEITIPGGYSSGIAKPVFKVPTKGIYKISLSNVSSSKFIVSLEGKNPIIDEGAQVPEAQFNADPGNLSIHFINMLGNDTIDLTAIITLVKATGNDLEVGGSNSVNMAGSDAPAKLNLVGVEAGKTYRLLVEHSQAFGKMNTLTLTYAGETYSLTLGTPDNGLEGYFYVEFEAVADEYAIQISNPMGLLIKGVLVKLEKVKEAAVTGPEVGDSVHITPGTSTDNAVELYFGVNFIVGGTYTIRITANPSDDDPEAFTVYGYYIVFADGSGRDISFTRGEENWRPYLEATFTVSSIPVKMYAEHMRMPNGTPIEVVVTVISAPAAPAAGPEVGDSVHITPGTTADNAVELYFGANFIVGGTYTIRITANPSDDDKEAFTVYGYHIVFADGSGSDISFTRGEENWLPYLEATFTVSSIPVKMYAEHMRMPNGTPIEVVVTVISAPAAPGAGPEVGDRETVTPGSSQATAVEIPFEFESGKTYTLKLTGNMDDGFFMFVYTIVYSNGSTVEASSGDGCFEVTITADGNPIKIYAVHMRSASPIPVEIEITAIA
ncbi:MAG: hypothetical protein J1G02_04785 [Clostridiales bacterium]|nr:hypothetical protein [Clostridiales bacterium]